MNPCMKAPNSAPPAISIIALKEEFEFARPFDCKEEFEFILSLACDDLFLLTMVEREILRNRELFFNRRVDVEVKVMSAATIVDNQIQLSL